MDSVLETSIFTRRADALLTRIERSELVSMLAATPLAGALVPGLGGIRKLRFAAGRRGQSGAFRVIYYVADESTPILALLLYGKNEQVNPTPDQRKAMLAAVERLRATPAKKG
jgi:mRNA-degrading endonuclease RelE of RelBE toxin-antitoxin system